MDPERERGGERGADGPTRGEAEGDRREERGDGGADGMRPELRGADYRGGQSMLRPGGGRAASTRSGARGGAAAAGESGSDGEGEGVAGRMPEQADLRELRVGFELPSGTILSDQMTHELRSRHDTRVRLAVGKDELEVYFLPPMFIDAAWPAQNMELYSAAVDLASGEPKVSVRSVGGVTNPGFVDVSGKAERTIADLLREGVAGTPLAGGGYDPFRDPEPLGTLDAVAESFRSLPAGDDSSSSVPVGELEEAMAGATVALTQDVEHSAEGGGVKIPKGGTFEVDVHAKGNLAALAEAEDPSRAAEVADVQSVELRSEDVLLLRDGDPLVRLEAIELRPGGEVSLERFTLMGDGRTAAGVESLVRLLASAARMHEQGAPPGAAAELAARRGNTDPEIVEGVTASVIEDVMSDAVTRVLAEHRDAVPGVDLAKVMGLGEG